VIKSNILDSSIAQAKRRSDTTVEKGHVLLALLSTSSIATAEFDGWAKVVEEKLGPAGTSIAPPEMSDEAQALIERCSSKDAAQAVAGELLLDYGFDANDLPATASAVATEVDVEVEVERDEPESKSSQDSDSLEKALEDLNALVGLESVKEAVASLADTHRLNEEREARGLPAVPLGLHLVFTGSPGTGKTTVARIVSRVYRQIGLLRRGHLVEVDRSGLVAGYVGQTALQVQSVVKKALGGVLFIDEAYALAPPDGYNDFGSEAVATLVKAMEDNRKDLALIVAGYQGEMARFIESNPGLRSRFQRFIDFPDYSTNDLVEIFIRNAAVQQIEVSEQVQEAIRSFIEVATPEVRLGNGRFVRNLFEDMYERMARRAAADGVFEDHEVGSFVPEDVPDHVTLARTKHPIGFVTNS